MKYVEQKLSLDNFENVINVIKSRKEIEFTINSILENSGDLILNNSNYSVSDNKYKIISDNLIPLEVLGYIENIGNKQKVFKLNKLIDKEPIDILEQYVLSLKNMLDLDKNIYLEYNSLKSLLKLKIDEIKVLNDFKADVVEKMAKLHNNKYSSLNIRKMSNPYIRLLSYFERNYYKSNKITILSDLRNYQNTNFRDKNKSKDISRKDLLKQVA